jgi:hypothetical protein
MFKRISCALLAAACVAPAWAASLSLGAVADNENGRSISLGGRFAPVETLTLGANIGHSRAQLEAGGEEFSGTSLGISADLDFGAFFAHASGDRWTDSNALRSTVLNGELGWMSTTGVALAALVTDRDMRVTYYTATVLGQPRERNIDFEGTGFGADLAYYGETWTAGVRFLEYDYGRSVARVRAAIDAAGTERFPRLDQLIGSVVTRAAGTPDRELSLLLGRQFAKNSLTAVLQWQRDALTGDESKSAGLTLGMRPAASLGVDISAGASKSEAGTALWAGLTLTLRSAP